MASLDQDIARLAMDIVSRVLSEFDNAELVARAACNALLDLRETKALTIRVHPSAEQFVHDHVKAMIERMNEPRPLAMIEPDEHLDRGSCILSTEFTVIEATIEKQLAAIAEALGLPKSAV
jgi:type III secretion protein L